MLEYKEDCDRRERNGKLIEQHMHVVLQHTEMQKQAMAHMQANHGAQGSEPEFTPQPREKRFILLGHVAAHLGGFISEDMRREYQMFGAIVSKTYHRLLPKDHHSRKRFRRTNFPPNCTPEPCPFQQKPTRSPKKLRPILPQPDFEFEEDDGPPGPFGLCAPPKVEMAEQRKRAPAVPKLPTMRARASVGQSQNAIPPHKPSHPPAEDLANYRALPTGHPLTSMSQDDIEARRRQLAADAWNSRPSIAARRAMQERLQPLDTPKSGGRKRPVTELSDTSTGRKSPVDFPPEHQAKRAKLDALQRAERADSYSPSRLHHDNIQESAQSKPLEAIRNTPAPQSSPLSSARSIHTKSLPPIEADTSDDDDFPAPTNTRKRRADTEVSNPRPARSARRAPIVESDGDTTNTGSADIPLSSTEGPRASPTDAARGRSAESTGAGNASRANVTAVSESLRSVSIGRDIAVQAEYGTTDYIVPIFLEGTAKAVGPYDWKIYVEAMEKFINGLNDEAELNKLEFMLFRVPSKKMRSRISEGVHKMITDYWA
jgi:hypothetical protein